jgi:hypothetical protein
MTRLERFDYSEFTAKKTDEGFLIDSPIIARTGIQEYTRADGSKVRELRLPEEVFNSDSLESMKAKPITVDHPQSGKVSSQSAHRVTVGTMLTAGRQDGEAVRADIVIHSPDTIGDRRELSLGYSCVLDETPGEWNGQKYDAIQREIKINHLSVVKKGRAGIARLNLDSNEEITNQTEQKPMSQTKVKLDNGLEYDAAPEVSAELAKLRADVLESAKKLDAIPKLEAERDILQARIDAHANELVKAKEQGRLDTLSRLTLEATAEKFKVDHKDRTDREVKEAVIKAVRKDADLGDKSEIYIDAAFDMAIEIKIDAMPSQRQAANTKTDALPSSAKSAYQTYMANLSNPQKEVA